MNLSNYPGYNSPEWLEEQGHDKYFLKMCKAYLDFLLKECPIVEPAYDIGARNPKIAYIEKGINQQISSLDFEEKDFNHDSINVPENAKTIFCFSILEHLTNPQFFLENLIQNMSEDAVLYLATPGRLKILWNAECHFHEMEESKLDKWLFQPLNLKIIKAAKIRVFHPLYFYLSGFRPLLRFFFDHTNIYKLKINA